MTRTELTFIICAHALAVVVTVDYAWRHGLRRRLAWLWWFCVEWVDDAWNAGGEGRHVALAGAGTQGAVYPPASGHNNLPQPGIHPAAEPVAITGLGQPGWVEDDANTLDWTRALHQDDLFTPDELIEQMEAQVVYDQPPAGARVLLPVQGEYVPVKYEPPVDDWQPDDTQIDIKPEPRAGRSAWARPAPEPWEWDGHTFRRTAPTGLAWLDDLCTRPIRQLEAAA